MSDTRYHTVRWRKKRRRQLALEPLCRYCLQFGRNTAATVADHITPHRGDAELFWKGPLQSLCASCHSSIKQAEENQQTVTGLDGWPVGGN